MVYYTLWLHIDIIHTTTFLLIYVTPSACNGRTCWSLLPILWVNSGVAVTGMWSIKFDFVDM